MKCIFTSPNSIFTPIFKASASSKLYFISTYSTGGIIASGIYLTPILQVNASVSFSGENF
jgi:hypothetical protein